MKKNNIRLKDGVVYHKGYVIGKDGKRYEVMVPMIHSHDEIVFVKNPIHEKRRENAEWDNFVTN